MSFRSPRDWRRTTASSTAPRTGSARGIRSGSPPVPRTAARSQLPHPGLPCREEPNESGPRAGSSCPCCSHDAQRLLDGAEAYKEAAPWTPAQPADGLPRGNWWTMFGDADLNELQTRLLQHSPDLAAALARYHQAKAFSDQLRSGLFPSLALGANAQRDRQSNMRPLRGLTQPNDYNSFTAGVEVDYEFDLWGRIRNEVNAGRAQAQASSADLESARLSLQAQLADDYLVLRGLDRQVATLNETVKAYESALELTQTRHDGGIASGLDVARAQTQLGTSRSLAAQTLALRAVAEHAIAALVGESPSEFSIPPKLAQIELPQVPVGVPATLVQRRPDIAAAERRIVARTASVV